MSKKPNDITPIFSDVRVTELGKIKIGGLGEARSSKGGGTYRMPRKFDHFVITTMNRGADIGGARGDLTPDEALMIQLKEDARFCNEAGNLVRIPIYVLSNEIQDIMQSAFVWYSGKTVAARAVVDYTLDEPAPQSVTWFYNNKDGHRLPTPLTEVWDEDFRTLTDSKGYALLKFHTTFNCVIAAREAHWGGVYKFRTTSVISAKQLYSGLMNLSILTNGVLMGLPMQLFVRPIQVSPDGKATTVHVVGVEMLGQDMKEIMDRALDMAKVMLTRGEEVRRIQVQQRKMLVAPGFEGGADAAEINEEFQPETAAELPDGEPDAEWEDFIGGDVVDADNAEADAKDDIADDVPRCIDCGVVLSDDEGPRCYDCERVNGGDK